MTTYTKINLMGDTGDARFCKALSKESGWCPEISTKILSGEFGSGDEVSVTLGEDGLDFEVLGKN